MRSRKLISVFGKLTINRVGYSLPGERRIFPLDGNLNLTGDIYSFGVRRKVAYEVSKNSFTEALKTIESHIGVRIPKRQSEELSKNAARDFENYYESNCTKLQLKAAKPLSILALTTDGKGIVVCKKDLTRLRQLFFHKAEKSSNTSLKCRKIGLFV